MMLIDQQSIVQYVRLYVCICIYAHVVYWKIGNERWERKERVYVGEDAREGGHKDEGREIKRKGTKRRVEE